jgi:hypothetical protein
MAVYSISPFDAYCLFRIEKALRDGTMTDSELTQIGRTRVLRFVGFEDAAPGECCYFTLTPTRYSFLDEEPFDAGELRDWKGRHVARVDLDQSDLDTEFREIRDYMMGYWRAQCDLHAEQVARGQVPEQKIEI